MAEVRKVTNHTNASNATVPVAAKEADMVLPGTFGSHAVPSQELMAMYDITYFISRPVTVKAGNLAPGPISRQAPGAVWSNLAYLKPGQCNIALQTYHIQKGDGDVVEGDQTPANYHQVPPGNLCFHDGKQRDDGLDVETVRQAVFRHVCAQPDGTYVLVGMAWGHHTILTRSGMCHSLEVKGWRYDIVPVRDYAAITAAWERWLQVGVAPAPQEQEAENPEEGPPGVDVVAPPAPVGEGYHAAVGPVEKIMARRQPLVLEGKPGSGETARRYYGQDTEPVLLADALAALSLAAPDEPVMPAEEPVWRVRVPSLTGDELLAFVNWLASSRLIPPYVNTAGSAVPTLRVNGDKIQVGEHEFVVSPTGLYLPDGRCLNNAVIGTAKGGKPGDAVLVNSFGLFALYLVAELPLICGRHAGTAGRNLERKLPFAEKSGSAGGGIDSDRLRWETGQFVVLAWAGGPMPNGEGRFTEKYHWTNVAFDRWGLVPVPNGNFVDGRLVAWTRPDGTVAMLSNKVSKLAKRLSQQYATTVTVDGMGMKHSVQAWVGPDATRVPSNRVLHVRALVATTLVTTPGAVIELQDLSDRYRVVNRVSKSDFPVMEVDPENPVTQLPQPDVLEEGATVAVINGKDGEQLPIRLHSDCEAYELRTKVVTSSGYPRVKWQLVCTRYESARKYRGVVKGVGTKMRVQVVGGTNAEILVPSDANKSNDSILGPLDYICQTVFAAENQHSAFCRELKKQFLALNRKLYGDGAPTAYAVLSVDFHAEYEQIIRQFWNHFADAKWVVFEADESFAAVQRRLRVAEDGTPINGWALVPDVPEFLAGQPVEDLVVVADGDLDDLRTNILATYRLNGRWYVAQRCCCLDEGPDGAVVYWPMKVEYTTVAQSVGRTRPMTSQLVVAMRDYPQVAPAWVQASVKRLPARAKAVLAHFGQEGQAFDGQISGDQPLRELVADLPEVITITAGMEKLTVNPHAVAALGGEGHDELSLPELLREVLACQGEARAKAIRRYRANFERLVASEAFWKGCQGPEAVTAKVMGLPHLPLGEVWVKQSDAAGSVYRYLQKVLGSKLQGRVVLLGRAPMAELCPLVLQVVDPSHPDYDLLVDVLLYVNPLVTAWHGGDCDGDNNMVADGHASIDPLTLDGLLNHLVKTTGSNQLAQRVGEKVCHGSQYLGDWYEIKRPEKLLAKRTGFFLPKAEAKALFVEAEEQHSRMVGYFYSCGFMATVHNHPLAAAMMNAYETVLGGLERDLYRAFKAYREGEPADWHSAGLFQELADAMPALLEMGNRSVRPVEFEDYLLAVSRGQVDKLCVDVLEAHKHVNTPAARLLLRWLNEMKDAIVAKQNAGLPQVNLELSAPANNGGRKMVVAVTGHRPNKLYGYDMRQPKWRQLKERLKAELVRLGATHAISGMALGVDMIFAAAALELEIHLEAAVPCQNQDRSWSAEHKESYRKLLELADLVTLVSDEPYRPELMQRRNEYMVDRCDVLIAVWNGSNGGTANCVRYAQQVGKPIVFIDPHNLDGGDEGNGGGNERPAAG